MNAVARNHAAPDFKVRDPDLAGFGRTEIEIAGDKGVIQHSSQYPFTFRLRKDETEQRAAVPSPESPLLIGPYTAEMAELLGALTGGPAARVTMEDGLAALEIGEACWISTQTGEPVTLPLPEN